MTENNSEQTPSDGSNSTGSSDVNRRRVLQGIGAAGVAGAVGTGSAQAGVQTDANYSSHTNDTEIMTSNQFWTYFENSDLSVSELIYESADAGYDAVEPFMLDDEDAIAEALDDTGLELASAHQGLYDTLDDPEGVAETYQQFGEPALIEAYINGDTWSTEESVLELAHDVNTAADEMADHGLEFGYHNHDHEFVQIEDGDEIAYDIFAEEVEDHVHLQIDAGWVLAGGEDPIEYIIEYPEKVKSIHMKNMVVDDDGHDFAEVDEGDVNMRAVATAARNAADVDLLVYEYDAAPEPIESMNIGGEWMNRLNHPYSPGGIPSIEGAEHHPAKL